MHLLRWLAANTTIKINILLLEGGEIEADFKMIAPTYVYNIPTIKRSQNILKRSIKKLLNRIKPKDHNKELLKFLADSNFDLIYLNTVASNKLALALKSIINCPIVCHVHENEYTIKRYFPFSLSESIKASINHYIAVSKSGKSNLINNHSINPANISLFYEFVPINKIQHPAINIESIKSELGINKEFIVGGSGLTSWRKGADIFVNLALHIKKIKPDNNIKFIWVGFVEQDFKIGFEYEKARLGLKNEVQFIGSKSDPNNFFQAFDIFTLTSREDPFPLVCLEAAALSKPILCFEDAGGIPEFVNMGAGISFPYGQIEDMALKIVELSEKPELVKVMGKKAKELVNQFDSEVIAPQIYNLINTYTNHDA